VKYKIIRTRINKLLQEAIRHTTQDNKQKLIVISLVFMYKKDKKKYKRISFKIKINESVSDYVSVSMANEFE